MPNCKQCTSPFEITDEDRKFYDRVSPVINGKKYSIPEPTLCPQCRSQRRMAFRNERGLYKRKSDLSGQSMLSIFSPDKPYKVYSHKEWWSDDWDAMEYGREFDFNRPFFEQLKGLWEEAPVMGRSGLNNENCDYVNYCGYSRNCYLCYNCDFSEDLLYCSNCIRCKDSMDLFKCVESENCYGSADLYNCYNIQFSQYCFNCSDSYFLQDCQGCKNCFGCYGLRNKEFHFFNEPLSKEAYQEKIKKFDLTTVNGITKVSEKANNHFLKYPRPAMHGKNYEDCSGDYIFESKNAHHCFDVLKCENIKYCGILNTTHDCYDWDYTGYDSQFCYELSSCGDRLNQSLFSHNIWSVGDSLLYCVLGTNLKNCFGCVGLRNKRYCIFNKQYSKEEYEALASKIIEHMQVTGEWGEFFPIAMSPFAYNETVAHDYFPLTEQETEEKGWDWKQTEDKLTDISETIPAERLPDRIEKIPDDILNWAVICEKTKRPYKIISQELKFYRNHNLPVPHLHPDERYKNLVKLRNPWNLHDRQCFMCQKSIQTTYSPDRPEKVCCENCYLKNIY